MPFKHEFALTILVENMVCYVEIKESKNNFPAY